MPVQRLAVREQSLCNALADDRDGLATGAVIVREVAAGKPRDAEYGEEVGRDDAAADPLFFRPGQLNGAIAESKRAQELDPLSPLVSEAFAEILYHTRQYDQAIAQCKKMLELDPNSAAAHSTLGLIYQQKKMFEEAVAETQTGLTLSGEKELAIAYGRAYSLSGYRSALQKILDEAAKKSSERTYFGVAADYAFLGEKEKAFAWLEKAYEVRSPGTLFLKVDPRLDPLRSDPRFADLLRRMGLPP